MVSRLQKTVGNRIRKQFQDFRIVENYRPQWMTSDSGERLELDFYIQELSLAFEIQGAQHYHFVKHFHRTPEGFADQLRRDVDKRGLCERLEIELIEVGSIEEFENHQERLEKTLAVYRTSVVAQKILKRASQEIITLIELRRRILGLDYMMRILPQYWTNPYVTLENLKAKRDRLRLYYERHSETIRYLSIRTIQEESHGPIFTMARGEYETRRKREKYEEKKYGTPVTLKPRVWA